MEDDVPDRSPTLQEARHIPANGIVARVKAKVLEFLPSVADAPAYAVAA